MAVPMTIMRGAEETETVHAIKAGGEHWYRWDPGSHEALPRGPFRAEIGRAHV